MIAGRLNPRRSPEGPATGRRNLPDEMSGRSEKLPGGQAPLHRVVTPSTTRNGFPMHTFLTEVRQTLIPTRSGRDGPLPPLLVAMTLVTGLGRRLQLPGARACLRGQHDGKRGVPGVRRCGRAGLLDRRIRDGPGVVLRRRPRRRPGRKEIWDTPWPPAQHGDRDRGGAARPHRSSWRHSAGLPSRPDSATR